MSPHQAVVKIMIGCDWFVEGGILERSVQEGRNGARKE